MAAEVIKWVRWLTSTDSEAFSPDPAFRDQQRALGITCPQCGNIRPERSHVIDRVVVQGSQVAISLPTTKGETSTDPTLTRREASS